MNNLEAIINFAKSNGGIVTSKDTLELNVPKSTLPYLENKGELYRVSRGIYTLPDVWEDNFFVSQIRYKRGIYSRDTALYLHNLVDRTPHKLHMAFPKNYYAKSLSEQPIIVDRVSDSLYSEGIEEIKSPMGNTITTYSKEKTLCEILLPANNTDIQIVTEAFNTYVNTKENNIVDLLEYATRLSVNEQVRNYLEVLL